MPRRVILIPLVAVAVVCVAVLTAAIWRQADSGPAIATAALGVWQEQTAVDPVRMTVSAAEPDAGGAPRYWVDLPSSFKVPFPARLEGDALVIWGENAQDVVWRITYDEGADVLLLTRPDGTSGTSCGASLT